MLLTDAHGVSAIADSGITDLAIFRDEQGLMNVCQHTLQLTQDQSTAARKLLSRMAASSVAVFMGVDSYKLASAGPSRIQADACKKTVGVNHLKLLPPVSTNVT